MTDDLKAITHLNDLLRITTRVGGRVFHTAGISALSEQLQSKIYERVETFDDFTEDNDPYGEHDLGSFERVLSVPDDADVDEINAIMKSGLLTIQIPHLEAEKSKVKQITIDEG